MTGSGTVLDPYVIWDVNDLQDVGNGAPYLLSDYYELGQNIDAVATAGWNWDGTRFLGFAPIGTTVNPFSGNFDGQNYTISGFYINRPATHYVGLFAVVQNGGIVRNLTLNCEVYASSRAGGLVGVVGRPAGPSVMAIVEGCHVRGTLTFGSAYVGGLAGEIGYSGTVRRCSFVGTVRQTANIICGGLIGWMTGNDCWLEDSYADVDIQGSSYVAGLVGTLGRATSAVRRCYASGTVRGDSYSSGLCIDSRGVIEDSYSLCDVSIDPADDGISGILIFNSGGTGQILRCYAAGVISAGGWGRAGIISDNGVGCVVTDCFWDTEKSGVATSAGGEGKTTAEMKKLFTFEDAGWDIEGQAVYDPNNGYPFLSWQVPGSSPIWYIYYLAPPPPIPSVLTLPATEVR